MALFELTPVPFEEKKKRGMRKKFVEADGGHIGDIRVFGHESNPTTWNVPKMNLVIRGSDTDLELTTS